MLSASSGQGKSIISAQIALSLSCGISLFDYLPIPKPRKVYYIQVEGSEFEQYKRIFYMRKIIPCISANIAWDYDKLFNVQDPHLVAKKLVEIEARFTPDVVIIDPIYKIAGGDLKDATAANAVIHFSDLLTNKFKCAVLMVHHFHREKYNIKGKLVDEDDPYYGHSFLKNHVDTSYVFKYTTSDGSTSELTRKKRREENTTPHISLRYNPETYTVTMQTDYESLSKTERVYAYLEECRRLKKTTDFYEIKVSTGVSDSLLRDIQTGHPEKLRIRFRKRKGHKTLWEPY